MIIKADNHTCFVFDLDDTLYSEIDFLKSAYREISIMIYPEENEELFRRMLKTYLSGGNSFLFLLEKFPEKNMTLEKLLYLYRNHFPVISLREGVAEMLGKIKLKGGKIGIITDGRSVTQRNKLKALGIEDLIDDVIISEELGIEKPDISLYKSFNEINAENQCFCFGDNVSKDFVTPRKLSWICIGILDKQNIHKYDISSFPKEYLPYCFIKKFTEIEII